jgi:hypothetical protein
MKAKKFSNHYLENNVVVFDGGIVDETAPCLSSDVQGWCCHRIKDGDLQVYSPPSGNKGLLFQNDCDDHPKFILLPRVEALKINSDGKKLCQAMKALSKKSPNVVRGKSKEVFGNQKYCCIGAKRRRYSSGIEPGYYKFGNVATEDWDTVVKAVKRCEHAFYAYSDTDVIRHIKHARELVNWETIKSSDAKNETTTKIFNGIAFGVNVYLRAHIDQDFTYSVIQVHVDGVGYSLNDDVVCNFCFPKLGVAVALKPGDFLLINALEHHCLSSRCHSGYDIFCVSSYLKTAVVSGNDNSKLLSTNELQCLSEYDDQLKGKN